MTRVLCLVFFASGAAALLFETLWFRQAGLALGNSVWAASLVTASFMGGLALGNAVAARFGRRLRHPLRAFATVELAVGLSGAAVVFAFPWLASALAPRLGAIDSPFVLNATRVAIAFLVLVIPSSAMGATLPLLAKALTTWDANFGKNLGQLYGWNTLGAVLGAVAGELFIVERLGIRGTALIAAGLDFLAAGAALGIGSLSISSPAEPTDVEPHLAAQANGSLDAEASTTTPSFLRLRLVAAAFLSGGVLLGLEVTWFRFLQLFLTGTSLTFALMLAVVLLGIGGGGLVSSSWLGRNPAAFRHASRVALAVGIAAVVSYAVFPIMLASHGSNLVTDPSAIFWLSLCLMLPVSALSGLLFPFVGRYLYSVTQDEAWAAGTVTFSNTLGAMAGALATGFYLLPTLGVERSWFVLSLGYLAIAALLPRYPAEEKKDRLVGALVWGGALVSMILFPFGAMNSRFMPIVEQRWSEGGAHLVAAREGVTETVLIFRRDFLGQAESFRLVTNGAGMSATGESASRYMGLYVWLPVALHPEPKSALLISYGMGTTARALVDTDALESIDVVDISGDVLELSAIAFESKPNPLDDPRVTAHIEDGRFFLSTAPRQFDIITAEPPPPKAAGIVNLYSQEYFQLLHDRLAPGGIATYWLPVSQMELKEARAIITGFCSAFADCSLWTGQALEWMLVGTRGLSGPTDASRFASQWQDPAVGPRLREAGIETPAQLGALFLADAETLQELAANQPPLDDDHPHRLNPQILIANQESLTSYVAAMDVRGARDRFEKSDWIRRIWPEEWREATVKAFDIQAILNRQHLTSEYYVRAAAPVGSVAALVDLDTLLSQTELETAVLWATGTNREQRRIVESGDAKADDEGLRMLTREISGLGALSRREYDGAESFFAELEPVAGHGFVLRQWRILTRILAGDLERGRELLEQAPTLYPNQSPDVWNYLSARLDQAAGGAP